MQIVTIIVGKQVGKANGGSQLNRYMWMVNTQLTTVVSYVIGIQ